MCQNISRLYFKFALAALISVILGILAGATLPAFPAYPTRFLKIELLTSGLIILTSSLYLLTKQGKVCQYGYAIKYYIGFLLTGAVGSFITSVIGLSSILTTTLGSAIVLGFAVGFFALTIFALILTIGFLLYTFAQS